MEYLKRKAKFYLIMISLFLILVNSGIVYAAEDEAEMAFARVTRIVSEEDLRDDDSGFGYPLVQQVVEMEILTGEFKGVLIESEHIIDYNYAYNIFLEPGNEFLVIIERDDTGGLRDAFIVERARQRHLLWLGLLFVLSMAVIGGRKGIQALVALVLTGVAIIKILLPMILAGSNPILVSLFVCIGVIVMTLMIIGGITKKTFTAIIGTSGGLIVAGALAYIAGRAAQLTGLGNQEAQLLMFIPQEVNLDFQGILFAAIILGAMGAVMDVGMSVASAMWEVAEAKPDISQKELMRAGMNVGRDLMGTMSNTLILAYTGGALHLLLLFLAYEVPFMEIINQDMIASEVVRALAGSIGLFLTVPITALVAATIGRKKLTVPIQESAANE